MLQENAAATTMDVRKQQLHNFGNLVTHIEPSSSQVQEKNVSLFDPNEFQKLDLNSNAVCVINKYGNVISDKIFNKEESENVSNYTVDILNKNTSLIQCKLLNDITDSLNTDQKFNKDSELHAIPTTFQDILFWPKTTFQKKEIDKNSSKKRKRQTETIPAVITSDDWKKYKLEKELQKIKKKRRKRD